MPQTIELTIYEIHELEESAKSKAREWYIENVLHQSNTWYEATFNDFETICEILGITLRTRPRTGNTGTASTPPARCIWFSGFWHQGAGACFEGSWTHAAGSSRRIRAYAPLDDRLHKISDALTAAQKPNFYKLEATIRHEGRDYHAHNMRIEVTRDSEYGVEPTAEAEEAVTEAMRELARWLYRRLHESYESEASDEVVDETIQANGWRFTADGAQFDV